MSQFEYPIIVVGAGAGGLVVAIGSAKAGKRVLLIEKGHFGGDCTNYGCIPSKSLIASAHAAHQIRTASKFGISQESGGFDGSGALERTRSIIQHFRSDEGPEKLGALGVDTLRGSALFLDSHTLEVRDESGNTKRVTGKNIVLATGSTPMIPPISGLLDTPYLTNESIFQLDAIPKTLAVIGGGAIGCELAQAFSRLGSQVVLLEAAPQLLIREEPETQDVIEKTLKREGVTVLTDHMVEAVGHDGKQFQISVNLPDSATEKQIECQQLLVAVGRKPNFQALNVAVAGIEATSRGIWIDAYCRTSEKNIWALGDVTGLSMFTHVAEMQGRAVLKNLLAPWPFKFKRDVAQAVPYVTYTDPEIARVGLTEHEAKQRYGAKKLATYTLPMTQVDRAVTCGQTEGFIKLITWKWSGKLVGASICCPRAGEMLPELSLALRHKIPLRKLSELMHPYPTFNQGIRRAADKWLLETILPSLKRLVGRS